MPCNNQFLRPTGTRFARSSGCYLEAAAACAVTVLFFVGAETWHGNPFLPWSLCWRAAVCRHFARATAFPRRCSRALRASPAPRSPRSRQHRPRRPRLKPTSAFMQDMIMHHGQAVEMTELAKTRAKDPAVKEIAAKIDLSQGDEIRWMKQWLTEHGIVAGTDGRHAGHEHAYRAGRLPGKAPGP